MIKSIYLSGILLPCVALFFGCQSKSTATHDHRDNAKMMLAGPKVAVAEIKPSKAAATQPANTNVTGTVVFTELPDGKVIVVAHLMGLEPNTKHGFHIHEKGDMSAPDLMSTGGHYNPDKHVHGGPATSPVHAGDLGNISADATGHAKLEITVDNISLGGEKNDVVGKAVIVHAKEDDLKSQPTGNAGGRVAGGVIEMKK